MIRFVYGITGSGKSRYVYENVCRDIREGKKVLLLVPEQEVLKTELECASRLDGVNSLGLEVVSFRRLCNRVFREYGGLCRNYITAGGKALLMWRSLRALAGSLSYFSLADSSDPALIDKLLSFVNEMKAYKISAERFSSIAAKLEPSVLADKADDLAAVYLTFDRMLHESYDDSSEDVYATHELFLEYGFFPGVEVYIDSFYGFTPDEYDIISDIFNGAENTTVSLMWDNSEGAVNFERVEMTKKTLSRLAKESGSAVDTVELNGAPRFKEKVLEELVRDFFVREQPCSPDENGAVSVVACGDVYNEAAWIAADVRRTVREEGLRYRDIAVVARDVAPLEGILDEAFASQGVPYHMSRREDITSYPIVRYVIFALLIAERGWKLQDVISFIKTGMADVTVEEADLIENYASLWDINSRRAWCGVWNMNPRGFTTDRRPEDAEILDRLNDIRERITLPLETLIDAVNSADSALAAASAVYDFLLAGKIPEKAVTDNDAAVWNALCSALDDIAVCGGNEKCDISSCRKLLSCVFRHTDFGSIPNSTDEVTVSGAPNARLGSPVKVYICGANEGVFPAYVNDGDLLDDSDLRKLSEAGLDIGYDHGTRAGDELLYFYRAAFAASKYLTVSYRTAGENTVRSDGCRRFLDLIPGKQETVVKELDPSVYIENRENALRHSYEYIGTPAGDAVFKHLGVDPELSGGGEVSYGEGRFSAEIVERMYGKRLGLSQTRIENFMDCPFAYTCKHILKLSDEGKKKYDPSDIGVFVHEILENYFSDAMSPEPRLPKDVDAAVAVLSNEYMDGSIGGSDKLDARTAALFTRLGRTTAYLIKDILREIGETDFKPKYFELPIGLGDDPKVKPLTVTLDDGTSVSVGGVIDRVDVFESGDDAYIRIVDYKTGKKALSVSDAEKGKNLQMLLYLFSICDDADRTLKKDLGCAGKLIPAGVEYYLASDPVTDVDNAEDLNKLLDPESINVIKRSGYALNEERFLLAMDKDGKGSWLPVNEKGSKVLIEPEKFAELDAVVREELTEVAKRIKSGDNSVRAGNACRSCRFKSVCRRENN